MAKIFVAGEAGLMLVELSVVEQRYHTPLEVPVGRRGNCCNKSRAAGHIRV